MRGKLIRLAMIWLVLVVAVSFAACTGAQSATQPERSPQPAIQPEKGSAPGPGASKPAPKSQVSAEARDTPANRVYGSGSTAVSNDAKLTFGTGGRIEKLNVKKGDRVTKGMVLAKLDTNALELAVLLAKTLLAQVQLAQSQAEVTLKQNEASVASAALALDKIKAVTEIKDEITNLEWGIKVAEERMKESSASVDTAYWRQQIAIGRADLTRKKKELSDLLAKAEYSGLLTYDIVLQKYDRLIIEDARLKQRQLEAAELSVVQAKNSIEYSKNQVESAKKSLEMAEKALKEATIIAPFDGVVATLDVKEGDIVAAPAAAQKPVVYLIDPTTMELNIGVNELDVPKVKTGQKAIVSLGAFPDVKLEGTVTTLSPVPDVQGTVVDYQVKIAFAVPSSIEVRVGMRATAEIAVK